MSIATASSITNLTVLALEPDPEKARIIQRLVAECPDAGLTVVRSKDELLDALRNWLPDLLLLPALLPPGDESQLFDYLRASTEKRHLEVLATPCTIVSNADEAPESSSGWRRLLRRTPPPQKSLGSDLDSFGERVKWALGCAQEARLDRAEHYRLIQGASVGAWQERRLHRRFTVDELPWLQVVRIPGAPKVKLLDLSAGGALLQSDTRLLRNAEGLLELVGAKRRLSVPFRVIRWQPSSHDSGLRYLGACAFTGQFALDSMFGLDSRDGSLVPGNGADSIHKKSELAPFIRSDEPRERDPRLTRGDVPWLSSVKLPWGPEVDLLNISKSGMLVETTSKFAPGSSTQFHLSGPETDLAVSARVVRSEVAAVSPLGVKYQAAVTFAKEFQFPEQPGVNPPAPKALTDLLTEMLTDVSSKGDGNGFLRKKFSDGLRKLVRAREIAITTSPVQSAAGAESIYFSVPGPGGAQAVLQATFEPNHAPSEVEFRCLQSAAKLATVVLEFERLS